MFDVSGYEGKKIKVTLNNGSVFKGKGITFMLGESFDEEFNSLAVEVNEIVEDNGNINKQSTISIYEDEVKNIELL